MRPCVVIPALNEADSIQGVIREARRYGPDIIVVDDGSDDATYSIAKNENAFVIKHEVRSGKGAALRDGFDLAAAKGYDAIIVMDADGQHEPSSIPDFIKKYEETKAGVICGNRMANHIGMPRIRVFTNWFMSSLISLICRQRIPDTQCGYRLYSAEALKGVKIESPKFEIESELLIKLAKKGFKIESVPIKSIYGHETSHIRPFKDTMRFIAFLFRILFKG